MVKHFGGSLYVFMFLRVCYAYGEGVVRGIYFVSVDGSAEFCDAVQAFFCELFEFGDAGIFLRFHFVVLFF